MEVVVHWDSLLEILIESKERANVEMFTKGSVDFELHGDQTLKARFALIALIVNCVEHKSVKTKSYGIKAGEWKKRKGIERWREKRRTKTHGKNLGGFFGYTQCVYNELLTVLRILGSDLLSRGGGSVLRANWGDIFRFISCFSGQRLSRSVYCA